MAAPYRVIDADGLPIENLAINSEWGDVIIGRRYSPGVAKTWGELPTNLEVIACAEKYRSYRRRG